VTRNELETLVRIHQAEVYRYLRYLGAFDGALAEDLVQETFLAAWRSRNPPPADDERGQASWLRGIARNLFYAHCRKKKAVPLREGMLEQAEEFWVRDFLRSGDGYDYVQALRACVQKLDERRRHVLGLCYVEGKSRAEMAEALQMTENGVKSALQRLRAILADCIEQRLKEEA
jgi:RNA polymerase sigma-70 factor (ECF subfamily)